METARSNPSKAKTRMKPLAGVLGLLLFHIGAAPAWSADEVTKVVLEDHKTLNVTIQQRDDKYIALLQLVLPASFGSVTWSCAYQLSAGLHLTTASDGRDLAGKLLITVDSAPVKVTADSTMEPGSILFQCVNQRRMPRTATIKVKFLPEPSLGENVIRLGDSRPVLIELAPEGDHYRARLDFIGASAFNCTYPPSADWQLVQDGAFANGTLFEVMPGRTKVELVAPAAADKLQEFPIDLNCGDSRGESVTKLLVTLPKISSPLRTTSLTEKISAPLPGLEWPNIILIGLLVLAIGGCAALYWLLQKTRSRQNTRIEFDDKNLSSSRIFDLTPGVTQSIRLRAPKGYDDLKAPPGKHVSVVEVDESHQDHADREGNHANPDHESENGQGRRCAYHLTLKPDAKDRGAEILWFTAKANNGNFPNLAFPIFVCWNAPAQSELIHNGDPGQPGQPAMDLKAKILVLGVELAERDRRLSLQLERLLEYTAGNRDGALEFRESLDGAKKEILESLYSEVNRATGDSLGEIRDAIKKQLCEDFSKQLSDIGKLVRPAREDSAKADRDKGASKSGARMNSEQQDSH